MYSTCLFCHGRLGANEALEAFPVGRRIAFDAARGRLWVVCPACRRWNLSPLEERWEAVEACERLFRGTRLRASTANIGLARLRAGFELVRIGEPLRPEVAAWRYGRRLAHRMRRDLVTGLAATAAGVVSVPAAIAAAVLVTPAAGLLPVAALGGIISYDRLRERHVVALVPAPAGAERRIRAAHLKRLALSSTPDGTLGVDVMSDDGKIHVAGAPAERLVAQACVQRNKTGGNARQIEHAIALIEKTGGVRGLIAGVDRPLSIRDVRQTHRLALEMALSEEAERRALEGELAELEREWCRAEEIAAIADRLLLPPGLDAWLEKRRRG